MMRGQVLLPIRRPVPGRLRLVPASDQRRVRGPAPRRGHVALRVRGVHAAARGDALAGATRVYCHVTRDQVPRPRSSSTCTTRTSWPMTSAPRPSTGGRTCAGLQ